MTAAALLTGCGGTDETADTLVVGGVVWTGQDGATTTEAVAVAGGRVLAVGSDADLHRLAGPSTQVIDAAGRFVMPGFIDSHVHFLSGGFNLASVQLRDADTPEEFARRIGEFARDSEPGAWITGGDWDHEAWGGELPRKEWVDSLTPENPVFVSRLDGHMALANSVALEAGGINASTSPIEGGEIERDPVTGDPTGILRDEAMGPVAASMPERSEAELDVSLQAAVRHALSRGVTQVHDMAGWTDLATYRRARARGGLPLRVYTVVPMSTWERLRDYVEVEGRGDDRLWWGGLKAFVDGSLGSTTAWFYEPYTDEPQTAGLLTTDTTELASWIEAADRAGLHVIVHAIGDRANDWLLDVYERVAQANGDRDRRFRVEHAQHLSPEAIDRFSQQGVIPSMQPYHAIDDGRWAEKRIGPERIRTTYAFRSLSDAGAALAFGSDWTVAPIDPVLGLYAAVTRRTLDRANPDGWVPAERIGVEETLRAYTRGAAYAGFMDGKTGVLQQGAFADLVILDQNPFEVDAVVLDSLQVDLTMVDGEIVYQRK
jgi:predicted amidohydrolase YtcJ